MEDSSGERKVPPPGSKTKTPPPKGAGGAPAVDADTAAILFPVAVAILVLILTLIFFWRRKGRRGRSVLLVGPCDAGKTALFSRIVGGPAVQTVTSLVPNELEFVPSNGKPALVIKDLPGHDRVQIKFWDTHKQGARGIVCVVDAASGNKGIREAADVLYRVLTDSVVLSGSPSIYIFSNKQDQPMSKATKVIKNQLEKELTTLRMTKSASLSSTGGKESSVKMLGRQDKDFEFDHISHQLEIEFGEGSATEGKENLEDLLSWLDSIA